MRLAIFLPRGASRIAMILALILLPIAAFWGGVRYGEASSPRFAKDDPCAIHFWRGDQLVIANVDDYECEALKPAHMRGIWTVGGETSSFRPAGRSANAPDDIWLEMAPLGEQLLFNMLGADPADGKPLNIAIDFHGYRTIKPGRHGHLGETPHKVIVSRIISAKLLPPKTSPPS